MRKGNCSSDNVLSFHRKEVFLTEAKMPLLCQIRSKTESPCLRRAIVEMRDETQGLLRKPLAEALERMRRERAGGTGGIAAGRYHRL